MGDIDLELSTMLGRTRTVDNTPFQTNLVRLKEFSSSKEGGIILKSDVDDIIKKLTDSLKSSSYDTAMRKDLVTGVCMI